MSLDSSEIKVWSRFERKLPSGETVKLRIQSVPKGKAIEVAEYIVKHFLPVEVWLSTCEIHKNPKAIEEYKRLVTDRIEKYPTLLCCVDADNDDNEQKLQIAGCNYVYIARRIEVDKQNFESKEINKMLWLIEESKRLCNLFDKYGVDEYLRSGNLSVHPDYRGCGIAVELLKTMRPLCEQLGMAVTAGTFTGVASQRAADKTDHEVVIEVDYKTFGEMCGVVFNTEETHFKIQAIRIR